MIKADSTGAELHTHTRAWAEGWYRFGTSEKANGLLQNKDAYVFVEESGSGEDAGEGEGGSEDGESGAGEGEGGAGEDSGS